MPIDPRLQRGGRKGYDLEKQQLDLMRKIVSRDLKVVEKIYNGKATEEDFKKLQALQTRVSKYLDKLHATRESQEHSGEINLPIPLLNALHNNNSNSKDRSTDEKA